MGKYEEARRRSRDVMVVEYKKERCKIDVNKLKKLFIAAGLTLVIASSALTAFITHSVDSIKDKITINEYLSQYSTMKLVKKYLMMQKHLMKNYMQYIQI